MTDSEIEQWVLKQLGTPRLAGCREVCVIARDGIVTIDGTVPSQTAKLDVQKAARAAKGVLAVVNNLSSKTQLAESRFKAARVARDLSPPTPRAQSSLAGDANRTY